MTLFFPLVLSRKISLSPVFGFFEISVRDEIAVKWTLGIGPLLYSLLGKCQFAVLVWAQMGIPTRRRLHQWTAFFWDAASPRAAFSLLFTLFSLLPLFRKAIQRSLPISFFGYEPISANLLTDLRGDSEPEFDCISDTPLLCPCS